MTLTQEAVEILMDSRLSYRGITHPEKVKLILAVMKEAARGDSVEALSFQISRLHSQAFGQPFAGNDAYVQLATALTELGNA